MSNQLNPNIGLMGFLDIFEKVVCRRGMQIQYIRLGNMVMASTIDW